MKNTKFAKIIDEKHLDYAPYPLKIAGQDIFTDDPVIYLENGWKQNVYSELPTDPLPEGFYWDYIWTETDTQNVRIWQQVPEVI